MELPTLKKSKIVKNITLIMLSQIQSHFYTLATIRYLCKENPIKVQEALVNY